MTNIDKVLEFLTATTPLWASALVAMFGLLIRPDTKFSPSSLASATTMSALGVYVWALSQLGRKQSIQT